MGTEEGDSEEEGEGVKRLRRLLLVITATWAACNLWAGMMRPEGIMGRDIATAAAPLVLILVARFVLFGFPVRKF